MENKFTLVDIAVLDGKYCDIRKAQTQASEAAFVATSYDFVFHQSAISIKIDQLCFIHLLTKTRE